MPSISGPRSSEATTGAFMPLFSVGGVGWLNAVPGPRSSADPKSQSAGLKNRLTFTETYSSLCFLQDVKKEALRYRVPRPAHGWLRLVTRGLPLPEARRH